MCFNWRPENNQTIAWALRRCWYNCLYLLILQRSTTEILPCRKNPIAATLLLSLFPSLQQLSDISRNAMLAVYLWHPSSSSAGTHTLSTIPALAGSDICIPLLPRHSIIITVSFQTFCTRKEMKYKFMKLSEHFKILFPRGWGGCQYVFAHYKNGRFLARHPITFFLMCHVFYIMQM